MSTSIPSALIYEGTRYLADGYEMRKQVGETLYPWGVPILAAKGSAADSAAAGNVEAGTYRIAIVPESFLGSKGNPWQTDSNFDYIEVTVAADDHCIDVTLPIHGDPQVERLLVYRTKKDEVSPYYYAGFVANGTTTLTLNGADTSLASTDFLEGPISDEDSLAGPFRYGRPPVKTLCEVAMDDIVFVGGEEEYTDGLASGTNGSDIVTFAGETRLTKDMEGKFFRFADETRFYTIDSVHTADRLELTANYSRPPWKSTDPSGESFEIIGDANEVAPSAPGEPEHFCPTERFNVGKHEGGRVRSMRAYGQDILVWTEDRTYRVEKGYQQGLFNVRLTKGLGCVAPRSAVVWTGGCIHFDGTHLHNFYNGASLPISLELGKLLKNAVQARKKFAISCVIEDRLYFAISLYDETYLDTILVYDLRAQTWDQWDTFRIVDMQSVTVSEGRHYLYIEVPVANDGYGLFAFTDAAKNDGLGAADYSGSITSGGARIITVDATLPTTGFALKGLRLRVEWPGGNYEERWISANTASTITVDEDFDTIPTTDCWYTIGAMDMELMSGKIGIPDALVEQDIKHSEIGMEA